jgi:class 3 adenylate cyclase
MPRQSGTILIVDDNRVNRLLLARAVEDQGYAPVFAENGLQALEMMRTGRPDVVLLDVVMPEMDGYAVLVKMQEDVHLRSIPVIVVSSVDEVESAVKCIELGAEDYLNKPINPVLLHARIRSSIEKKRFRDWQRELIGKFATEEVAEQLLTSGFSLSGTSVQATALFCDIRSFTTIAEALPPEATIELLNDYYTLMMDAIMGAHGNVNQLVGDGMLAIFGAPAPLPDRAQHAVEAAVQMVQLMRQYSRERHGDAPLPVQIGVGIASGGMIAGFTGTQRRAIYTCVGDTVNLASRLESYTKEAGQPIIIDEDTRRGLSSDTPALDLGEVPIRGKKQPVHVYAVPVPQNP